MEQLRINNLNHNKTLGEVLKQNGVSFEEFEDYWEIANTELLGSGLNGKVFDIGNNQVLKITKDKNEYNAIKKCINSNEDWFKPYILLPKVICPVNENFFKLENENFNQKKYYFIFEKLYKLDESEKYIFQLILQYFDCIGFNTIKNFKYIEINEYFKFFFPEIFATENFDDYLVFTQNIVNLKNKFYFYDMHINNIMKDSNNNFKLTDFISYE